ncbi:MAG TPA: glutamate racemase [Allosphingosinicella sp.]
MTIGVAGGYLRRVTRPLLIFDSGVGGLSVVGAVRKLLPTAPIVYAADSAFYPYGTKRPEEIDARVPALLGRLAERYDPELIVIACNTASTIALDTVRAALDLPIVGTVPAIKPAAAISRSRVIGVLGTAATVVQPYVDRLAANFAADCTILRHGSHRLVELAEAQLRGQSADVSEYRAILDGLLDQPGGEGMDTVVLACTHFPLVQKQLEAASPHPLTFVDGKEGIARRVAWLLEQKRWAAGGGEGIALFTGGETIEPALAASLASFGLTKIVKF